MLTSEFKLALNVCAKKSLQVSTDTGPLIYSSVNINHNETVTAIIVKRGMLTDWLSTNLERNHIQYIMYENKATYEGMELHAK